MAVTNYSTVEGRIIGEATSGVRTDYLTDARARLRMHRVLVVCSIVVAILALAGEKRCVATEAGVCHGLVRP